MIASLVCGALFIIVTPPFAAPDEGSHFIRAWYVSEGHFGADRQGAAVGHTVPLEIFPLSQELLPNPKIAPSKIREALSSAPASAKHVFVNNAIHAWSSPLPYLPQAAGIFIGRARGFSPLKCFYLGRIANLLIGTLLIALSVRFVASYRWFLVVVALTPMASHLRGSLSADTTTMGLAFLLIALSTRALFLPEETVTWSRWAGIVVLGGLICLTKMTYIPIAALPLATPQSRFPSKADGLWARIIHAFVIAAASLTSSRIASSAWAPYRADVTNPHLQVEWILSQPFAFVKVLWLEHVIHAKWYFISMVGDIGAGDCAVALPKLIVIMFFLGAFALLFGDTRLGLSVRPIDRVWIAVLCAGSAFGIALGTYLVWNPVGWPKIDGLQGRYYLPFLPIAAFVVHRAAAGFRERSRMLIAIAIVAISTAVALHAGAGVWYPGGWRGWRMIFADRAHVAVRCAQASMHKP